MKKVLICFLVLFLIGGVSALTISNVQVNNITPFSAEVTWNSDETANSRVEFQTPGMDLRFVAYPQNITSHNVVLTSLSGDRDYNYRVISKSNITGETQISNWATFHVPYNHIMIGTNKELLVDGEPFFLIGQWLQPPQYVDHQVELGINVFVGKGGGSEATMFNKIREHENEGVLYIPKFNSETQPYMGDSSILGWYSEDEPDGKGNPPSAVLANYLNLKSKDPNHPFLLTVTPLFANFKPIRDWMDYRDGIKYAYVDYGNAADLYGYDYYPICGHCQPQNIHRTATSQAEFTNIYAAGKINFQWIEAERTKWDDAPCTLPDRDPPWDGVYDYEMRSQVWMAITNGAKGIGYFTHSWTCVGFGFPNDYTQYCVSPEVEAEINRTNNQIKRLSSAILSPDYTGLISKNNPFINYTTKTFNDSIYIFTVNTNRNSQNAVFTLNNLPSNFKVEVFDEARTITANGNSFSDSYEGLGVHIYKISLNGEIPPTPGIFWFFD